MGKHGIDRRRRRMKVRTALALAIVVATARPVAAQSAQERSAEALVRTANAAYMEALMQHQRLLAEDDPESLPPEDVRVLVDTTDRMLWAAGAMENMCATARTLATVLAETRCAQVAADIADLERQRAELRALLEQ
jgi:hypothetical protein